MMGALLVAEPAASELGRIQGNLGRILKKARLETNCGRWNRKAAVLLEEAGRAFFPGRKACDQFSDLALHQSLPSRSRGSVQSSLPGPREAGISFYEVVLREETPWKHPAGSGLSRPGARI